MCPTPVLGLVITLLYLMYRKWSKNRVYWKCISKIPGPKGKPIIGNLMDTYKSSEDLYDTRRKWGKEYYPIYKTQALGFSIVTIMDPVDIEKVLSNKVHDTKGFVYKFFVPFVGDSMFVTKGEKWRMRRKLLTPAFHFNILQDFVPIFNKEAEVLVKSLRKRCSEPYIDVMLPITEFSLCSIMETSMGIVLNEHESGQLYKKAVIDILLNITHRIARPWLLIDPIYFLTETYQRDKRMLDVAHNFSKKVITERKKTFYANQNSTSEKKKKALLDILLTVQQEGADISDSGICEEVDTFIAGGFDTTGSTICHALMLLAGEKQIQEELYNEIIDVIGDSGYLPSYSDLQELPLLERCIKETLRLYPSGPMLNRILGEDLETASGYTIPKGTNIYLSIIDMHRNPHVWKDPLKFDPSRFLQENAAKRHPYSFIPFSAGSRNCIGQKFAMIEMKSVLGAILRNFRLEQVDTPKTMKYKQSLILTPAGEMRVKFVPRNGN